MTSNNSELFQKILALQPSTDHLCRLIKTKPELAAEAWAEIFRRNPSIADLVRFCDDFVGPWYEEVWEEILRRNPSMDDLRMCVAYHSLDHRATKEILARNSHIHDLWWTFQLLGSGQSREDVAKAMLALNPSIDDFPISRLWCVLEKVPSLEEEVAKAILARNPSAKDLRRHFERFPALRRDSAAGILAHYSSINNVPFDDLLSAIEHIPERREEVAREILTRDASIQDLQSVLRFVPTLEEEVWRKILTWPLSIRGWMEVVVCFDPMSERAAREILARDPPFHILDQLLKQGLHSMKKEIRGAIDDRFRRENQIGELIGHRLLY